MELENCCQPDCWLEEFIYPEIPATGHIEYACSQFLSLLSNADLLRMLPELQLLCFEDCELASSNGTTHSQ
jgi:hypothetical protein